MATTKTAASKKSAAKSSTKKAPAKKKTPAKAAVKAAKTKKATKPAARKKKAVADEEVTIDRRAAADRRDEEAAAEPTPAKPALERREKVSRRRQIDPTTCERDYSDAEVEFMNALDAYKRTSGRMFPTCSEVLEVVRGMGYVQLSPAELAMIRDERGETDTPTDLESTAAAEAEKAFDESDELRVN